MKTMRLILITTIAVALTACHREDGEKSVPEITAEITKTKDAPPPPPPPAENINGQATNENKTTPNTNRKLIKKGDLGLSCENLEATKKILYGFLTRCKGYVASERLEKDDPSTPAYYHLEFNIEAGYFEKFLQLIDSSGLKVVSRNISMQDVTRQYVDQTVRLNGKKRLAERYAQLLSKANAVKDMIEIQEKLEEVQSEIESQEWDLKTMERQVAYSEIYIKLENPSKATAINSNSFWHKIGQSLGDGWDAVVNFVLFLIAIWPYYIVIALLWYFGRKGIKKWKARKQPKEVN
ncbi:MAG: DUF4349 domain-containing protein [Bacteroidota bacterium]|nr:DUF4349 domain-containing protein [Bacteroidota bacterium]